MHQHRDHPLAVSERQLDFDTHEIIGIVEPPTSALVRRVEPALADHRQQRVALLHLQFQHLDEIFPGGNVVDVDENPFGREGLFQAAEKRLRKSRLVTAPIVDEYLAAHAIRRRSAKATPLAAASAPAAARRKSAKQETEPRFHGAPSDNLLQQ